MMLLLLFDKAIFFGCPKTEVPYATVSGQKRNLLSGGGGDP